MKTTPTTKGGNKKQQRNKSNKSSSEPNKKLSASLSKKRLAPQPPPCTLALAKTPTQRNELSTQGEQESKDHKENLIDTAIKSNIKDQSNERGEGSCAVTKCLTEAAAATIEIVNKNATAKRENDGVDLIVPRENNKPYFQKEQQSSRQKSQQQRKHSSGNVMHERINGKILLCLLLHPLFVSVFWYHLTGIRFCLGPRNFIL